MVALTEPLLSVSGLRLSLPSERGRAVPVDGVSFSLQRGECVGLVGESGCGKTLTALSLLGLTRSLPGAQLTGRAELAEAGDLVKLPEGQLAAIRGRRLAMVFQDPLSALN